ncbi:MAG: hypothetical protein ACE5MH_00730, partial [Terriglobia bacterium]
LQRMLPFWRKLEQTLGRVDVTVKGLEQKAQVIDKQMEKYEGILKKADPAAQSLSASQMTHFIASGVVLVIAVLAAGLLLRSLLAVGAVPPAGIAGEGDDLPALGSEEVLERKR